jgi:hypothetical protein
MQEILLVRPRSRAGGGLSHQNGKFAVYITALLPLRNVFEAGGQYMSVKDTQRFGTTMCKQTVP